MKANIVQLSFEFFQGLPQGNTRRSGLQTAQRDGCAEPRSARAVVPRTSRTLWSCVGVEERSNSDSTSAAETLFCASEIP